MKKIFVTLFAALTTHFGYAQSTVSEVFTTLKPTNSLGFYVIQANIFGINFSDGITCKYDKNWQELEKHDAGQESLQYTSYKSASLGYEYDSSKKCFVTTTWNESEPSIFKTTKYSYNMMNYTDFYSGKNDKLYFFRSESKSFLYQHTVSTFYESLEGIAGKVSNVSNNYTTLTTALDIIDWDGNNVMTIDLPYYGRSISTQFITVEDKDYLLLGFYDMYKKDIKQDVNLYSTTEYKLEEYKVEPDYYHYFVYEWDRKINAVRMVRSYSTSKAQKEIIGIFDTTGKRLPDCQKGLNIILYSDGSSEKIMK